MKAIGYIRLSKAEHNGNGAGLTVQRERIEAAVQARGWTLQGLYEDAGFTGGNLKRPAIREALSALQAGEADVLVVSRLDRLSRSIVDFTAVTSLAQKQGWSVVILDPDMDTTTPMGEMMMNMLATFAQFERRLIGQRIKEALAVKRAEGVRLGRARMIPPEVWERIHGAHAQGKGVRAIARDLNNAGVPTAHGGYKWHPSTVASVLRQ